MQVTVDERGAARIVRVQEPKMLYPALSSFYGAVRALVDGGTRRLVLDLQAVNYVDSATIGCLLDIHRLLRDQSGMLRLVGLQPRVETMLLMTGVHKIIALHRSEEEALAAFDDGDRHA